jgi:hypothetical protein
MKIAQPLRSSFEVVVDCDTHILLIDKECGASVTNDADAVIAWLQHALENGIGARKVFYRDTAGRFDELSVKSGKFDGFKPCSDGQQKTFAKQVV